ncbi:hypothetical protein NEUTE2DRAFT_53084 [Neurospora tetrasperma FGSC 2509]|nr:hypothetical protein NEUTE2DRAFT_53084 [Neurospora tetrasperma FGSC 2509]
MPRPQLGRFTTKQQHVLVPPSLEFVAQQLWKQDARHWWPVGVQPWVLRIGERTDNLIGDDA